MGEAVDVVRSSVVGTVGTKRSDGTGEVHCKRIDRRFTIVAVPKLLRLPNSCLACAICSRGGGTIAGIRYFYLAYIIYIKTILFTIRPPYLYLDI